MSSEFDFLRAKWPKLAAMAADATRLADVSPSSALSSLRTFCEWSTDIALDFYELQVSGGASQIEKLESLQTSGMIPSEVLQKFHNVRSAGGRTSMHEIESAAMLVHGCIADCRDIGQWLFREAEKEGWPHIEGYSQSYSAIPMTGLVGGSSDGSDYDAGGDYKFSMSRFMRRYGSIVTLVIVVVVLAGIGVGISYGLKSCNAETAPPQNTIEITPSPTVEAAIIIPSTPTPEPTPEEDPFDYIDDLPIALHFDGLFTSNWNFNDKTDPFAMNDRIYDKGLGMFIAAKRIVYDKATLTAAWNTDQKYYKVVFDMGCEQSMGYDIKAKFGRYKIVIIADGKQVWTSGYHDYSYVVENQEVIIGADSSRMEIVLTQYKGEKGTLNVVLGNFKLYKNLDDD